MVFKKETLTNTKAMCRSGNERWSSQHLEEIVESAIMNLNTGKKQELHNIKFDSEITISSGLILIDGIPIKLEI